MNRRSIPGAVLLATLATSAATAETPSPEQMWALIQQQQAEIEALKRRLSAADNRIDETVVKVEATADRLEQDDEGTGITAALASTAGRTSQTHLGGYGEMHLNKLENDLDNGDDKDTIDYHRFVLLLSHQFSPRTRFFSELEVEHSLAGEGKKGEVEIEQAYVEHDLGGAQRLKAGLFLIPVGILNETHEPDTFYGVERNPVENRILPTTWWEGGVGLAGEILPGLGYDAALTSGLGFDASRGQWSVRDGRQKVSEANASAPAWTGRLKYTGVPGLELAATMQYQDDLYQGEFSDEVDGWLFESHLAWQRGPFALRALYADWQIDEAIEFFRAGADRQSGWYVEPSWRITPQWGVFARYNEWDNQAGEDLDTEYAQWDVGLNYWLEEGVVFKLDYQRQDAPEGRDQLDGLNLGVGFSY